MAKSLLQLAVENGRITGLCRVKRIEIKHDFFIQAENNNVRTGSEMQTYRCQKTSTIGSEIQHQLTDAFRNFKMVTADKYQLIHRK